MINKISQTQRVMLNVLNQSINDLKTSYPFQQGVLWQETGSNGNS